MKIERKQLGKVSVRREIIRELIQVGRAKDSFVR